MAIADGKVSLKHLVTMETLTNEEVLGLIRRGEILKMAELISAGSTVFRCQSLLKIQHERTSPSKWLRKLGLM
ncbi:MAG: hypothetical protein ACLTZB_08380 [Streptococcus salivarius]